MTAEQRVGDEPDAVEVQHHGRVAEPRDFDGHRGASLRAGSRSRTSPGTPGEASRPRDTRWFKLAEKETSHVGQHPSGRATGGTAPPSRQTGWFGWIVFAGVIMLLLGSFHAMAGLVALFDDEYFLVNDSGLVVSVDYTGWGWTHLIFGVAVVLAGFSLSRERCGRASWPSCWPSSAPWSTSVPVGLPDLVGHHDRRGHPGHLRGHGTRQRGVGQSRSGSCRASAPEASSRVVASVAAPRVDDRGVMRDVRRTTQNGSGLPRSSRAIMHHAQPSLCRRGQAPRVLGSQLPGAAADRRAAARVSTTTSWLPCRRRRRDGPRRHDRATRPGRAQRR